MLDLEQAAIRGRLAEAKEKEANQTLLIEGFCTNIRTGLNTALTAPGDLEIPALGVQWDALEGAWGHLQVIRSEIARLERGLH